jgi:SAM-dependent methyltransferase
MEVDLDTAESEMLSYWKTNEWFVRSYWPENCERVRRMLGDLTRFAAKGKVFEPGCGNGYVSFLASRIGYDVTACDSWFPEDRTELFARARVNCFKANLNRLDPWPQLRDAEFDSVLFGEVIEHILNHPLGLCREIHRVLKPGGLLILTTPNPETLANSIRTALGRHSIWGTEEFMSVAKIENGEIIDQGDIHFREYRQEELLRLLRNSGFDVVEAAFITTGSPEGESPLKRLMKSIPAIRRSRLFGSGHYIVARAA